MSVDPWLCINVEVKATWTSLVKWHFHHGLTKQGPGFLGDYLSSTAEALSLGLAIFSRGDLLVSHLGTGIVVVVEHVISLVANILVANWKKGVRGPAISMWPSHDLGITASLSQLPGILKPSPAGSVPLEWSSSSLLPWRRWRIHLNIQVIEGM